MKGVGGDNLRTRLQIAGVDLCDDCGLRQHQQVVVALHALAVSCKALAAECRLIELVALDHGAHAAVDDENTFGGRCLEGLDTLGAGHAVTVGRCGAVAAAGCGRRPRRWQMA